MAILIGDSAPDFEAETTEGRVHFYDYIDGHWAVLFSHPKNFTPVCTTELGYTAKLKPDFDKRDVKVLGISVDKLEDHAGWAADISCNSRGEFLPSGGAGLFSALAHNQGSNYGFADGHAKWYRFEQTMKQQSGEPVYNDAKYQGINSWIVANERCFASTSSAAANTPDAQYWGMWTIAQ